MSLKEGNELYFVAVVVPTPFQEEIQAFKHHFREMFNTKGALNAPAHITLHMPFQWKSKRRDELVEGLSHFAITEKPFGLQLEGFGSFPPRVIFVEVKPNEALHQMQARLMKFCRVNFNLFNAEYKDLPFHPHVTVAFRDLRKKDFVTAWKEASTQEFETQFEVNHFSLLKHNGKTWDVFQDFYLDSEKA